MQDFEETCPYPDCRYTFKYTFKDEFKKNGEPVIYCPRCGTIFSLINKRNYYTAHMYDFMIMESIIEFDKEEAEYQKYLEEEAELERQELEYYQQLIDKEKRNLNE